METVQKAVRDAADGLRNLAFGEQTVTESAAQHGEEPVSGVQGRGTPTDPYDAGNRDGEFRVQYFHDDMLSFVPPQVVLYALAKQSAQNNPVPLKLKTTPPSSPSHSNPLHPSKSSQRTSVPPRAPRTRHPQPEPGPRPLSL